MSMSWASVAVVSMSSFPLPPPSLVHVAAGTVSGLFPTHTHSDTCGIASMCVFWERWWMPCQKSDWPRLVKPWMNGKKTEWVRGWFDRRQGSEKLVSLSTTHTHSLWVSGLNWPSRDKPALSLFWQKRRYSFTVRRQLLSPNHPLFKPLSSSFFLLCPLIPFS